MTLSSLQKRFARSRRTHAIARASGHARLVVFRSNKAIYAQLIDDSKSMCVCGDSTLKDGSLTAARAMAMGERFGAIALEKGYAKVAFDRNGYKYHGVVKALAEGARKAGLQF